MALTLIGIHADIPLYAEVTIMIRILESLTRSASIYMIQGGTDRISTNGAFTSDLKLLRIRGINDPQITRTKMQAKTTGKDASVIAKATKTNANEETLNEIAEDFNSISNTSKAVVVDEQIKFTQGVWLLKLKLILIHLHIIVLYNLQLFLQLNSQQYKIKNK